MLSYFAIAPLKAYLFDVLVWAIIEALLLIVSLAILKRTRLFVSIFGTLLLVSSIPIAVMSEFSINGCCGEPDKGHNGLGYAIGGSVAIIGMGILVFGKKLAKRL